MLLDILEAYDSPAEHWGNEPADDGNTPLNDPTGHDPSSVHSENDPTAENNTSLDDHVTSDYSSSVHSEDELEGVNRRVHRVSSDDSSSLYSNNDSGVAGPTNPFTEKPAARVVSPSLGFSDSSAEAAQEHDSPTLGHFDESELPRAPTPAQYYPIAPLPQRPNWAAVPARPRASTPTPTPALAYMTLPPQADWAPVVPRLSALHHPGKTPLATPLPPAIPPRKRRSLTGKEMSAIAKRADAALETRQLPTGSTKTGQTIRASPTSPDSKAPGPVPECPRVDRVQDSEGSAFSGHTPTPQLVSGTQSQLETTPTRSHAGPSNGNFQLTANKRSRNIAPDRATYRVTNTNQENGAARQDPSFSPQPESIPFSIAPLPAPSALVQRIPTPLGFLHAASASRESLADSDVSTWHPAPTHARISSGRDSPGPHADASERHASLREILRDREQIVQASERLRSMGSGYATQRAAHRASKSADLRTDFGPGFAIVDTASGNGVVRADHPSHQETSTAPKASFKEKIRGLKKGTAKITGMLKLRKSSKNTREDKAPEGSLDMTSLESGRKTPELMKKVRSIPSLARLRQRSHMDLRKAGRDGDVPPVPAIPLRHRKTSAQVAGERGV